MRPLARNESPNATSRERKANQCFCTTQQQESEAAEQACRQVQTQSREECLLACTHYHTSMQLTEAPCNTPTGCPRHGFRFLLIWERDDEDADAADLGNRGFIATHG
eukprot:5722103-Amphidinium_carterae.1